MKLSFNEMEKLETEFWNHAMVEASHAPYTDRFYERAVQKAGTLIDEADRNGSLKKNPEKRGNFGETNRDRNVRDENKRTRTGNAFATTTNQVRREYNGTIPKCVSCNLYHPPEMPCRACFNCGHPRHMAKDCRVAPRMVNPVNNRNLIAALGAWDKVVGTIVTRHAEGHLCWEQKSFVSTTFIHLLGIEPSNLGFSYEIEIASEQLVEINKVIRGCKLEIKGHMFDINLIPFGSRSFDVIIGMDWLSNHKAEIIFHEKVIRIPLQEGQVLRVIGERPKEKMRHLMSTKAKEQKQEKIVMKLETKFWNHAMVGVGHATYTDRFNELSRLVSHLVTPENKRIKRYIYGLSPQIRGMVAATEPEIIHRAIQKAGTLTDEAVRNGFMKKKPSERGNRMVNPVNARNLTAAPGACYECREIDHFKAACPRLNQAQRPGGNRPNQVVANNGGPSVEQTITRHVEGIDDGSKGGSRTEYHDGYEIEIASGQLVEIDKVIRGCKLEIEGHMFDINLIPFGSGSFDVIIGMDWLSNHKAEIICHEKEKAFETLKDKLCNEPVLALPDGLEDFVVYCDASCLGLGCVLMQRGKHFSNYDCEIRYHLGKENVVADALSRKKRIKPRRIRAMNMTLQSSIKDKILAAQEEAPDESAVLQRGLDGLIKRRSDGALYYLDRIWVPIKGDVRNLIMDEAHKSKYSVHSGADKMYYDLKIGRRGNYHLGSLDPFEITERINPVAYRLRLPKELNGVHDTFHVLNLNKYLADPTLQIPLDEIQVDAKLNFME
ncbi:putative reverse transcriptase domain-containing protein [Tanacetum coccineum]